MHRSPRQRLRTPNDDALKAFAAEPNRPNENKIHDPGFAAVCCAAGIFLRLQGRKTPETALFLQEKSYYYEKMDKMMAFPLAWVGQLW